MVCPADRQRECVCVCVFTVVPGESLWLNRIGIPFFSCLTFFSVKKCVFVRIIAGLENNVRSQYQSFFTMLDHIFHVIKSVVNFGPSLYKESGTL